MCIFWFRCKISYFSKMKGINYITNPWLCPYIKSYEKREKYVKSRQKVAMIGQWDVLFTWSSLCIKLSFLAILSKYCSSKTCDFELKFNMQLMNLEWNYNIIFVYMWNEVCIVSMTWRKDWLKSLTLQNGQNSKSIWLFLDKANDQQW